MKLTARLKLTVRRSRRTAAVVAAGLLLALVGGCGGPSGTAGPVAATSFRAPRPQGVRDPAVIPSAAAAAATGCDPRASLRPSTGGAAPNVDRIKARGRLVVGVDQNTYLFGYRDAASGQVVGFDIDIARQIAAAIFGSPDRVQLTAITSAQRIPFIQNGSVDLVVDTMTINCDRLKQVAFSTDYYDAGQRVLVPRASTANGIADLRGKKVCAAAGSTSITNIANAPSHPVPVSVADWTDCLVMLQQGQVEAISTDDTILAGMAAQDPNTKLVGNRFTDEPYGVAISRSAPDLVRFVNGVLDRMRADGRWAAIYTRWLGGPAPAPPAPKYSD
jgi:polar amino acid transport system substrate-binding protein